MLRKATLNDIPGIHALINGNLNKVLTRTDVELRELIDEGMFWVVEDDDKVVGCCCLELYSQKIAELRTLVVSDHYRGKGYGEMLVNVAVREYERRNIRQLLVVTSEVEFFEKYGFGPALNEKYALFYNGQGSAFDLKHPDRE